MRALEAVAPAAGDDLAGAWLAHLRATGRGNIGYERAARAFFRRWPDPRAWTAEPLQDRLAIGHQTRPLLLWMMLHGHLRPGYDWLVECKLAAFWRELPHSPLAEDVARFVAAAGELGFAAPNARGIASQVVGRVLIQTGRPLGALRAEHLDELVAALVARRSRTGKGWKHYRMALHTARTVLFHLGVLPAPPAHPNDGHARSWQRRLAGVPDALVVGIVAYLERLPATHAAQTISHIAVRLAHFGRHLAAVDPDLAGFAGPSVLSSFKSLFRRPAIPALTSFNAGVPLQALMALLGHVSANMSLRYGRLFDATVRADYERALTQAKAHLGGPVLPLAEPGRLPIVGDWKDTPAIKARMAGGYCIRTPAQGSCAYANICEHCPNYRSDPTSLPILATQKSDAEALAADIRHLRGALEAVADNVRRHEETLRRLTRKRQTR